MRPCCACRSSSSKLGFGNRILDRRGGASLKNALKGFQESRGLKVTGTIDPRRCRRCAPMAARARRSRSRWIPASSAARSSIRYRRITPSRPSCRAWPMPGRWRRSRSASTPRRRCWRRSTPASRRSGRARASPCRTRCPPRAPIRPMRPRNGARPSRASTWTPRCPGRRRS
ncbi:peptidoglycan-binding domain-containing protein [Sphingomonas sp. MMS24-JH45]